jgi:hypothetical protein
MTIDTRQQLAKMFTLLGGFFLLASAGLVGLRQMPQRPLAEMRAVEGKLVSAKTFFGSKQGSYLELKVQGANQLSEGQVRIHENAIYQKLEAIGLGVPIKVWIDGEGYNAPIVQVQVNNEMILTFADYQVADVNNRNLMGHAAIVFVPIGLASLLLSRRLGHAAH